MKILQTIGSFGAHGGGTSTCTYDLLSAMSDSKFNVDLLTPDVSESSDILMGNGESWIKTVPYDCHTPYAYSENICKYLRKSDYDIYHTNGLWLYTNHITCKFARKFQKPYIITPHGMLYPMALKRSYWKKWPLLCLYFYKDIFNATCMHATCLQEMENIRLFGYKGPIAVIPNPANIPPYLKGIAQNKSKFLADSKKIIFGFLGRLHPVKKVENLLYALASLKNQESVELIIMGRGDVAYVSFLENEVKRLNLRNVQFKGFVNGKEKYEQLAKLYALFVPSDFENFGMIVTESLSVKTPVMASLGTPWEELNTNKCGWWIERTPENIAKVMEQIITMPKDELLSMGENGRNLVLQKYTASQVANQMNELYDWILHGGRKPNFVYELT